jgi:predicted enzyme related to lactoylglutathione lyase
MPVRLAYANILTADPQRLSSFYAQLLGFAEIEAHRSPIYRCLDAGGIELGFNASQAYELLGLADRIPQSPSTTTYVTFEAASTDEVDEIACRAVALGGKVRKAPYDTYYNARQAVLEDPDGNVFRINHRVGPRIPADQVARPPW